MKKTFIAAALCAAGLLQPAFAQEVDAAAAATTTPAAAATVAPPPAATVMPAPASTVAPPPAPAAQANKKVVPKLAITCDCGECEHNDKVPGLIEAAYAEAAKKKGWTVSETDIAEAAIIDIRQRPPGVRVMFGIMAGKDRLGMRIRHAGNEYKVSDYSADAINGMNSLSEEVGERAFVRLMMPFPPKTTSAAETTSATQ